MPIGSTSAAVDADALAWWADYSKQFPSVAYLAAQYMSMPEILINIDSLQSTDLDYWAHRNPHPLVQKNYLSGFA
jgi:hypothetical protein